MVNPGWLQWQPELRWFHKLHGDVINCSSKWPNPLHSFLSLIISSPGFPQLKICLAGNLKLALQ